MESEPNSLEDNSVGEIQDMINNSHVPLVVGLDSNQEHTMHADESPFSPNRRAILITATAVGIIILIGLAGILITSKSNKQNLPKNDPSKYSVNQLSTNEVKPANQLLLGQAEQLAINGQVKVKSSIVITPATAPSKPSLGELYYDKTTNLLNYYNGISFVALGSVIQGPVGPAGQNGLNGATGPRGLSGANGLNGADGTDGADGATGPQGPAGPSGTASCPNGSCISLQASSPGVVETGNINISGSILSGILNVTTALQLNGTDINTAGTLTNIAYLNQANNFTAANTFSAAGTALTVTNNASINGTATIGTLSVTNGATIGNGLTVTAGGATITAGNLAITAGDITTNGTIRLTNAGALSNITGYSQSSGNFLQSGSGTFGTGTGAVSLNGNTSVTGSNTFTVGSGATALGGTLVVTGVATLTDDLAVNGGDLTSSATTFNLLNVTPTTINFGGNVGSGGINLAGGSASTGCTIDGSNGNLTCSGNITGASTGTVGYWTRSGATLQPATAGDAVTTSGNISTTGSGTITSAGLLTGSLGATISGAAINLNASSNFATNINTSTSTGAVSIGNNTGNTAITVDSGTAAINIGTGAQARTVNIATGAGAQSLTLGSSDTTSSTLIQAGTNGAVVKTSNTTTAFQVQNASSTTLLNIDTTNQKLNTTDISFTVGNTSTSASAPTPSAGSNSSGSLSGNAATTYYYRVTAITANGESQPSAEASFNGSNFTAISAPGAPTATATSGAGMGTGTYYYKITFITANGETTGGTSASVTTTGGNQQVSLTSIPTGPAGTLGRKIYRTAVGGADGTQKLVPAIINNNTTTSYTDSTADASLVTNISLPGSNTARTDNNSISLSFSSVAGATSYRIYRSTTSGGATTYQTTASSPFTDTGTTGTAAQPFGSFQVQNASGTALLGVDSISGNVLLGSMSSCQNLFTNSGGTLTCGTGIQNYIKRLTVFGHSYTNPGIYTGLFNLYNINDRYTSRLAAMLGAEEDNYGAAGALAAGQQTTISGNGYALVLQKYTPSSARAPYVGRAGAFVNNFGINDLANFGSANLEPYKNAMRTIIARERAGSVLEETDSSVAYSPAGSNTFTQTYTNAANSGNGYKALAGSTANGSTITVTVPADFEGGTIDLGFTSRDDNNGGTVSFMVDGGAAGTLETRNNICGCIASSSLTHYGGLVKRLTGLSAGPHTIVATVDNLTSSGSVNFDYWQIESATPPPVLVPNNIRMYNYDAYASGSNYTPNDNDVKLMNDALQSVTGEFDSSVMYVDVDSQINKSYTYFSPASDLALSSHMNALGHAKVAETLYNALRTAPMSVSTAIASVDGLSVHTGEQQVFKSSYNATNAFQIQNQNGESLFNVDTYGANKVTNGSFETNLLGWYPKGNATLTRTTSEYYAGSAALQIDTSAAANDGAKIVSYLSTGANTLSFWVKLSSGSTSNLRYGYASDGSTETGSLTCTPSGTVTTGWVQMVCPFTVSSTSGTPYIFIKQTDATARTIYLDGVMAQAGTVSAPNYSGGLISLPGSILSIGQAASASGAMLQVNGSASVNGGISFYPTSGQTFQSAQSGITWQGSQTLDFANTSYSNIVSGTTYTLKQSANPFGMNLFLYNNSIWQNEPSVAANLGLSSTIFSTPTFKADSQSISQASYSGILDNPIWSTANSGTLAVTAAQNFSASATVGSGVTVSSLTGYTAVSPTGSGTITSLYGMDIQALTKGSTNNIGLRIATPSGATNNYALQLSGTGGTAASGITFGTDTNLYRSAADTLKTDDALTVSGGQLLQNTTWTNPASSTFSIKVDPTYNLTANNANSLVGIYATPTVTGTGDNTSTVSGFATNVNWNSSGTATALLSGRFVTELNSGGGNVTTGTGIYLRVDNNSATSTMTNAKGIVVIDPNGTGTITNNYGIDVDPMTRGGTNNYGIRIGTASGGSGNNAALQLSGTGGTTGSGILFGTDTNLYRSAASTLVTNGAFIIGADDSDRTTIFDGGAIYSDLVTAATVGYAAQQVGDANYRFTLQGTGQLTWGDGTNPRDTNLYRSAADTLKTDDALTVAGALTGQLGISVTGATANLNVSSNFATNINTGTSTGAVTIGNNTGNTALSLQSGTSTIDIGTGAQARAVNVATGAAAQTLILGSTNTSSTSTLQAGTGGISVATSFASSGNSGSISLTTGSTSGSRGGNITLNVGSGTIGEGNINIGSGAVGTINIGTGGSTGTATINLGTVGSNNTATTVHIADSSANVQSVTIGSISSSSSTTIRGGTNSSAVSIQTGASGTLSVGTSGVANTIQIGNTSGAVTQTINIGTNSTASSTNNVTIGSTIAGAVTLQSGTSIALNGVSNINASANNATNINTGTSTGAVGIGNSSAGAISVQSGSTVALTSGTTLTLTSTGANNINLYPGGTSNTGVLVKPGTDSTLAFQVQNTATTALFTADTSGMVIKVGGTTSTFATLEINNAHFKSTQTNVPTIGTPTNCGASPTAAVTASSTDSAGSFTITPDTSSSTCDTIFTFNKAYGAAPKSVIVTPKGSADASAVSIYVSATSTTTFTVKFGTSAANNNARDFYYWVIE